MRNIKYAWLSLIILTASVEARSQQANHNQFADITGTIGSLQGTGALAYVYNWKPGKKDRIEIGIGARWTTYFGTKKDFLTAGPAKKTRTSTTPFLIFFACQQEQNFDTLTVQRPLINSLNLTINLGYNFSRNGMQGLI